MKPKSASLLLHPVFLLSLSLLLLNDLWFKDAFLNLITGKLSDFTGIFCFALFFYALFPERKPTVTILVILLFCWWKSPVSESFIRFTGLHRTIDYTDLTAFITIPFAYRLKPYNLPATVYRRVAVYCSAAVALFAFCATSMMPRQLAYYPYRERETYLNHSFKSSLKENEILEKMDPLHLGVKIDSLRMYKIAETGEFVQRVTSSADSSVKLLTVARGEDTVLFVRKRDKPFYTVPYYVLEGDTLFNIEFSITNRYSKRKPLAIEILSFQNSQRVRYMDMQREKQYIKHFKTLFKGK